MAAAIRFEFFFSSGYGIAGSVEPVKIERIKLFRPIPAIKLRFKKIVTVNKKIYYRSVYLFIKKIRNFAIVKGSFLIYINLNTCLHGTAIL